ncbi:MAG: type II secretion system protein [Gemmataceae bacterium]
MMFIFQTSEFRMMQKIRRRAMTITEVLVVIAIIAVLIGLLLTAIQSVRQQSQRASEINTIRQFVLATQQSATKSGGTPYDVPMTDTKFTHTNDQQIPNLFKKENGVWKYSWDDSTAEAHDDPGTAGQGNIANPVSLFNLHFTLLYQPRDPAIAAWLFDPSYGKKFEGRGNLITRVTRDEATQVAWETVSLFGIALQREVTVDLVKKYKVHFYKRAEGALRETRFDKTETVQLLEVVDVATVIHFPMVLKYVWCPLCISFCDGVHGLQNVALFRRHPRVDLL